MKWRLLCLSAVLLAVAVKVLGQGPSAPYSVSLNWTLSTTSGVTGQNVYRSPSNGTACGTFTKLTSTQLSATATTFPDSSVVGGNWYCYQVTAVGPTGESG